MNKELGRGSLIKKFVFSLLLFVCLSAQAEKIGIYRGTFDPPHLGHITLIKTAMERFQLDQVLIMVNDSTPHKPNSSAFFLRYEMSRIAFSVLPHVRLFTEAEYKAVAEQSFDQMIARFARTHSNNEFFRIYGSDVYSDLFIRNKGVDISHAKNFKHIVGIRPELSLPETLPELDVSFFSTEYSTSSTLTRLELSTRGTSDKLPPAVLEFARKHGLYSTRPDSCSALLEGLSE